MRDSHRPENGVVRAARLQRDAVSDLVTDVYVHLVGDTEGQIYSLPSLDLTAHHHAVLVLRRQTELGTPLRDLQKTEEHIIDALHYNVIVHMEASRSKTKVNHL